MSMVLPPPERTDRSTGTTADRSRQSGAPPQAPETQMPPTAQDDTITIRSALGEARRLLSGHETPRLEAEVLLARALDKPRSHLHAWPERIVGTAAWHRFRELMRRRAAGEPVAYLTGRREFWSLELAVTPDTLIPRPETELLVELALEGLPEQEVCHVADLGTGSGAIALAIASERPACGVVATDQSPAALDIARANAVRLGLCNIGFLQGDWCQPLGEQSFDLIVSNPPYIADGDPHLREGDLRFEPASALTAGADGLDAIRIIASQALERLKPGGRLLVEHGYDQGTEVAALLQAQGYEDIALYRDGAGCSRVCAGSRPRGT
jgi:release factor glutamine methyltransferase